MSPKTLKSLFAHKSWANAELFAVLGSMTQKQSKQRDTCLQSMNHLYIVDRIFRAHLAGEQCPFAATNSSETPNLEMLGACIADVDSWYQNYVEQVSPSALVEVVEFTFISGSPGRMSREEILLHVITHGVYHRGSIAQVLKSISIAPPDDPYTVFLHHAEPGRRVI
ncbi:MAG: DinB family protein [Verrucomicrobiaceae bacterium]|nr:DinB family protein [Verrucomicrobiaceae bacterium]